MDKTFQLEIISPEGILYQDSVNQASLPSTRGEITILPHHTPMFTKLTEGELRIEKGKTERFFAIAGGFLEVQDDKVIVLSDFAVKAEAIEIAAAEQRKKKAEEALKNKENTLEYVMLEKELQKSILELNIAHRVRKRARNQ